MWLLLFLIIVFFFFKQKTAYEMRISDWSSDVCSSDLVDNKIGWRIFNHMVEYDSHTLDTIFHALGDTTRRAMLGELAAGERTVGEVAEPFAMSLAAVSKHIKVLETAGLVRRDVRGRTHVCSLDPFPLMRADQCIGIYRRLWTDRP